MRKLVEVAVGVALVMCVFGVSAVRAAPKDLPAAAAAARSDQAAQVVPLLPFQPAEPGGPPAQGELGGPEETVNKTPLAAIRWHQMEEARRLNRDRAAALKLQFMMERDLNQGQQPAE